MRFGQRPTLSPRPLQRFFRLIDQGICLIADLGQLPAAAVLRRIALGVLD